MDAKTPEKNPHAGHRQRVSDKFLKQGLENFNPHEALELALFFSRSRGDTNELAHRLIDKFGSFSGVLDAPYEELLRVKGVGAVSALLLKFIPAAFRYYLADSNQQKGRPRICSLEHAVNAMEGLYTGLSTEAVYLLLVDSQSRLLLLEKIMEGSANTVPVYLRRIVELAVRYNASGAYLSHNHPSGNPVPSKGDMDTTRVVYDALATVDVTLFDHIVFGDGDFVSMAHARILGNLLEPY